MHSPPGSYRDSKADAASGQAIRDGVSIRGDICNGFGKQTLYNCTFLIGGVGFGLSCRVTLQRRDVQLAFVLILDGLSGCVCAGRGCIVRDLLAQGCGANIEAVLD